MKQFAACTVLVLVWMFVFASAGAAQGVDLTSAGVHDRLTAAGYSATWAVENPTDDGGYWVTGPFHPVPNMETDVDGDGKCWIYGPGSDYSEENYCPGSANSCMQDCLSREQSCCNGAESYCIGYYPNPGTARDNCIENRQDACRTTFNTCSNKPACQ